MWIGLNKVARAFTQWITTPVAETRGILLNQLVCILRGIYLYVPRQPDNKSSARTRRYWRSGVPGSVNQALSLDVDDLMRSTNLELECMQR